MNFRRRIVELFHRLNPLLIAILKSPLHSMVSRSLMMITFTGKKTGKQYATPVSYVREGDMVYCFAHSPWRRNLRGGARVSLRLRGRELKGMAEPISEDAGLIAEGLRKFFTQIPRSAGFYQVVLDKGGKPNAEDLIRAARKTTMIQIRLEEI